MALKEVVTQVIYVCFCHKWNMSVTIICQSQVGHKWNTSITSGICRSQVEYVGHKWNIGLFGFNLTAMKM